MWLCLTNDQENSKNPKLQILPLNLCTLLPLLSKEGLRSGEKCLPSLSLKSPSRLWRLPAVNETDFVVQHNLYYRCELRIRIMPVNNAWIRLPTNKAMMLTCELKETTKKSPLLTRSGGKPQMGTKEMKVTVSHP